MDGNCGIMMCILKGQRDKRGHYDVDIKRWREKGAL